MAGWIKRYHQLPKSEKRQLMIILTLMVFTCYALVGGYLWDKMFTAQKLANRKANRIEVRIGNYKVPEIDPSITPEKLESAKQNQHDIEAQLKALLATMLPLGTPAPRELSKLEISRLAAQNQIDVVYFKTHNTETRTPPAIATGQPLRDLLDKRPYFEIHGLGTYYNFLKFIDGLSQLTYKGFVQDLAIEPSTGDVDSRLAIRFKLQM